MESELLAQNLFDKLPEQIQWKMYRAKVHYDAFVSEVGPYMNSVEFDFIPTSDSTPEKPMYNLAPKKAVPARFGLIAGDYLQNLRSVMDYLVWDLILANGEVPHPTATAFPVCASSDSFNKAKRKLEGVANDALDLLEQIQPYTDRQTNGIPLPMKVLDELTNSNKHRRVLLTGLATVIKPDVPLPFPHIEFEITRHRGGQVVPGERLVGYLVFQEGIIKGEEVTASLTVLSNYIGYEVLPLFEKFF